MACAAAHELDEVPVFLGGVAVALYVADNLGVHFGGGVEAERCFNLCVLEVAVDGFGAADHLHACAGCLVVFGENGGVGVGVVAADYNQGGDAEFAKDFEAFVELFFLFEFGASGTDDVEAACVAVFIDNGCCQFDVAVFHQAGRAHEEAEETGVAVYFLDTVEEAADNVVSAGCLAAGKNHAHVQRFAGCGVGVFLEADFRKAVGVGEKLADGFSVGNGFCRVTFYYFYGGRKHNGQLGLVCCAGFLQCALLHIVRLYRF